MFIGRKTELAELENRLMSNRFEMIPIYGRRRVGKTRLIEEFIQKKRSIFFTANQFGEESNLRNLSQAIELSQGIALHAGVYASFEEAFEVVASLAQEKPESLVFVIDEYPYLAQINSGLSSLLQSVIDKLYLSLPNLMLILTGSQLSFMEKQVLGYESPLYGRRTGQIKLMPLSFQEAQDFLPSYSPEDRMTIFGLTGGIPLYLTMMEDQLSLKENILKNILRKNTFLYEEPSNLLLQELRTPNRYNDILEAIANGATSVSELIGKTRMTSGALVKYLATLIELNIIEKQLPLSKIAKSRPIYKIIDGLFYFWYRYVPKYKNFIETDRLEQVWNRIEQDLTLFTSQIFEVFCRQWVSNHFLVKEVGSWWGNNPLVHNPGAAAEEVDIIGLGFDKDDILIAECKWRADKTNLQVGEKLLARSHFFPYSSKRLIIFSKSSFSEPLKEFAAAKSIELMDFQTMLDDN